MNDYDVDLARIHHEGHDELARDLRVRGLARTLRGYCITPLAPRRVVSYARLSDPRH